MITKLKRRYFVNSFQIECFLALSESLNFTHTASALFITQPTLSRIISSLEKELNMKLLDRNSRGVALTPAGKAFAEECPAIINAYRTSVLKAELAQKGSIGTLKVGFQRDTFEPFTVDLIKTFTQRFPNIFVELIPLSPSELLQAFDGRSVDAVVAGGVPQTESAKRLLLNSRVECAALPLGHPFENRESIRMEELKGEKFVIMSRNASCSGYESIIQKAIDAGFTPQIVAETDYVPSVLMLVACNKGISILYKDLESTARGKVKFVPLENVKTFDRWLIWDSKSENPCLEHLVHTAEEIFCG